MMICKGKYPMMRATTGSACYDMYAQEDIELGPDRWTRVDTGYSFDGSERPCIVFEEEMSPGGSMEIDTEGTTVSMAPILTERKLYLRDWVFRIYPRSSYGIKYGLELKNPPVIDMDYRDNIILVMKSEVPMTIKEGDRYAQGKFSPFAVVEGEDVPVRMRNGGVGSTGI